MDLLFILGASALGMAGPGFAELSPDNSEDEPQVLLRRSQAGSRLDLLAPVEERKARSQQRNMSAEHHVLLAHSQSFGQLVSLLNPYQRDFVNAQPLSG